MLGKICKEGRGRGKGKRWLPVVPVLIELCFSVIILSLAERTA